MILMLLTACLINHDLYEARLAELEAQAGADDSGVPDDTGSPLEDDSDGDGYPGLAEGGDDCDDADAQVHPGSDERCDDVDNDCDGEIDDSPVDGEAWYADADGDGFGDAASAWTACSEPDGAVSNSSDCDDNDASAHPGALESCDGADNDCDGEIDDEVGSTHYVDDDSDGYGDAETLACEGGAGLAEVGGDCDDGDELVNPGAVDSINGVDDDCSGAVDDVLAEHAGLVVTNSRSTERAGNDLALVDVANDGTHDLIVAAAGSDARSSDPCATYVFEGGLATTSSFSSATVVEADIATQCGRSIDARDDVGALLVGAPREEGGRVSVYTLADLEIEAEWTLENRGQAGEGVAWADVDADGVWDAVISGPGAGVDAARSGVIWVVPQGTESGLIEDAYAARVAGTEVDGYVGYAMSAGVDLNGDGYDDFASCSDVLGDGGGCWLIHGGTALPATSADAQATIVGDAGDDLGACTVLADDWDGDAVPEWWIGAPGTDSGNGALYAITDAEGVVDPSSATAVIQGTTGLGLASSAQPLDGGVLVGARTGGWMAFFDSVAGAVSEDAATWTTSSTFVGSGLGAALAVHDNTVYVGAWTYGASNEGAVIALDLDGR